LEHVFNIDELLQEFNRVLKKRDNNNNPFTWEEHEMPYDFARYTTPATVFISKHGFRVIENFKTGNYIEVIFQFQLNYKEEYTPAIRIKAGIFIPFIVFFNFLTVV
jgi:hypothetical protein